MNICVNLNVLNSIDVPVPSISSSLCGVGSEVVSDTYVSRPTEQEAGVVTIR